MRSPAVVLATLFLTGCLFTGGSTPKEEPDGGADASVHDAGGGSDVTSDGGQQRPDVAAPDMSMPVDLGPPPDMAGGCIDGTFNCSNDGAFRCDNGSWQPYNCPDDRVCDEMMGCKCRIECTPADSSCTPNQDGTATVVRCVPPSNQPGCPVLAEETCFGVCTPPPDPPGCTPHQCELSDTQCVDNNTFTICAQAGPDRPRTLTSGACPSDTVCDPDKLAAGDPNPCTPCANDCNMEGQQTCTSNDRFECRRTSPNCLERVSIGMECTPPADGSGYTWQFVDCGPQADDIMRCYRLSNGCGELRTEKCAAGTTCNPAAFGCL